MHFTTLSRTLLWSKSLYPVFLVLLSMAAASIPHPGIDFAATGGSIAVLGDFDGLSFYNAANASSFLEPSPDNSSALYLHNDTAGTSMKIATLEGGSVTQISRLAADSALIMGTFSSVNGVSHAPPVIFNVTSREVTPLFSQSSASNSTRNSTSLERRDGPEVSGTVLTTFVDGDLIYLGGDFEFNNTHGAAVYNLTSRSLSSLPFQGFGADSSVNAIAKYPPDRDDGSIFFGGSFHTLGLPELLMHNISIPGQNTTNSTNTTLIQAEQLVSLKHATFSSVNGASSNDDSSVICPSSSSIWSANDYGDAEWSLELPQEVRGITPTKFRIYVPNNSSSGIKYFRLYTYPNSGIMNLTYVDLATNKIAYCDAWCPLELETTLQRTADLNVEDAEYYSDDDDVYVDENGSFFVYHDAETKARNVGYGRNFQEFSFVNDVMVDSLRLATLGWYGSRAEFSGFELFSDSITVYGNETLNDSSCGGESADSINSAVVNSGTWEPVSSLTDSVINNEYSVSVVDGTSSMTLYPNISYPGYYSILFYTPGCLADGSCSQRSKVNVTVTDNHDQLLSTSVIYQNNLEDKFDYLFYGHLNGSSSTAGRNKIQVDFISAIDPSTAEPWMVVDKVVANIVSLDESVLSNSTNTTTNFTSHFISTMPLNGLFEYSLSNFTNFSQDLVYEKRDNITIIKETNTFVGNSTFNQLSGNFSSDSSISNIVYSSGSNSIVLSGELFSPNITLSNSNLVSISLGGYNHTANDTDVTSIIKRQLSKRDQQVIFGATFNNTVTSIYNVDGGLLALGDFSVSESGGINNLADGNQSTASANNFALYSGNQWYSFGNPYSNDVFTQFTTLYLNDTEYFVFSSTDGKFVSWDNTKKEWTSSKNKLDVSSAVTLNDQQQIIGGSSFGVMDFYGNDQGHFLNNDEFVSWNISITNGSVSSSYYLNSTVSVIGGSFTADESIENVALIRNGTAVSLNQAPEWGTNTSVTTLYINMDREILFIGTDGPTSVRNSDVSGLLVYSLNNETFSSIQPPDLSTSDGSQLAVNAMALYDQSSQLLVGGNFDYAGSLGCEAVCLYDIVNTRWNSPYSSSSSAVLSGSVTDARFISSDSILLSGNLTYNNSASNFIVYDFSNNQFSAVESSFNEIGVSEPISKFIINGNTDGSLDARINAIGSNYVIGFNGSSWSKIDSGIEYTDKTKLTDLKLVQLSQKNSNNQNQTHFDDNQALLVSGTFNLTGYGTVNLALYDGTSWVPYVFSSKNSSFGHLNSLLLEDLYKSQSSSDFKTKNKHMSVGQVVGVSLACALGSTAFLGLLYAIPILLLMKGSQKKERVDQRIHEDEMMDIVNPQDLIHEMDAQKNY